MPREPVAVIIPIYKLEPDSVEILSLKQCLLVLSKHPIIFVGSLNLNTSVYEMICNDYHQFKFIGFNDQYFKNIEGYNKLMLSPKFYKEFIKYKYILIYQLDAYVFKDELLHWCKKNYDFIGAPAIPHQNRFGDMQMLKTYEKALNVVNTILYTKHKISNVGNGGFSLRRTQKFYWLLKLLKSKIATWGSNNEDGFFKYWGNLFYPFFNLPSDEVALQFSVEHNIKSSLSKLGGSLPFGCHAFEKYEPEIWKDYIPFKIK
jgi:hypothetical protein